MNKGLLFYLRNDSDKESVLHYNENRIERLFKESFCDVQLYHMKRGQLLYIEPAQNRAAYKSYFIISGRAKELLTKQVFSSGDALLSHKMVSISSLLMEEDTEILVHAFGISVEKEIQMNKERLNELMEDLYLKDPYEKGHAQRVFEMVKIMGIKLGFSGDQLYGLNKAARFFDIGKIHIEESLLKKEAPLSFDEVEIIRFHVTMSDKLIRYYYGLTTSLAILEHHERWDGSGYPSGLVGNDISVEARLIAICDSFDAMTHERPYRVGLSVYSAVDVLKNEAGTNFDPELVDLFIECFEKGEFDLIIEKTK
jgi:HD-GYP domain-containing protein (c-di-GMP phosphodiesterase class II)